MPKQFCVVAQKIPHVTEILRFTCVRIIVPSPLTPGRYCLILCVSKNHTQTIYSMSRGNLHLTYIQYFRVLFLCALFLTCCAHAQKTDMDVTAYCGCKKCCGWTRGRWMYLKLNFWNRYYASWPDKGKRYSGRTASGTKPRQYNPGLFSADSVLHPWMIPPRLVFFPWLLLPHPGTIAADTSYYPFGSVMYVPGYGKGVVEDRGSAVKGPHRIDIFFNSHRKALKWGRKKLTIKTKVK